MFGMVRLLGCLQGASPKGVPGSKTVGRSPSLISLMVQQTSHTDSPAPATAWIRKKYDFFSKL
jgi:hypothetical protein